MLCRLRSRLPHLVLRSLYQTCVRPTLEYAGSAWIGVGSQDVLRLERTQRAAARLITGSSLKDKLPSDLFLARADLDTLSLRRKSMLGHTIYSLTQQPPKGPPDLVHSFQQWTGAVPVSSSAMRLHSSGDDATWMPHPRTELLRCNPFYQGISLLNSIPPSSKQSWSSLKSHILSLPS